MRYETAAAFRQAIEDRIRSQQIDPMRARHQIVFERVLSRLVASYEGMWVLKGAVVLEARFPNRARATNDLDLAVSAPLATEDDLRALVVEALASDPDDDWFRITLERTSPLTADMAGRPGWRLTVKADLDGREFAKVHVDVVARADEIASTERITLPNTLAFAELPDVEIDAVDPNQHFAEKLHAYTLEHGDRQNTRVKDLTDMVLLIENGLEPTGELRNRVSHVFEVRGLQAVPQQIPAPPASWGGSYVEQASEIKLTTATLEGAHARVERFWFMTAEEIV